jgi:perosamine synthetase
MNVKPTIIPWAKPVFWGDEEKYVVQALQSSWISGGPYIEQFERALSNYLGCKHAIAVCNGTSALHLAYLALGLKAGDEIIAPAFGFMAAANVGLQLGLRPVFCDVDPVTWCMRASDVSAVLSPKTRAIVVVHNYGNVCEMEDLQRLSRERSIPLIEDAAEALGSQTPAGPAGSLGTINIISFHATKTITTGEGGLVTTNDDRLADMARLYCSHGLRRRRHYWHEVPGHNFRITNLQAALGCAQFEYIETIVRERRRVCARYERCLRDMQGITLQQMTDSSTPLVWAVAAQLSPEYFPQGRDEVLSQMMHHGIETRPGFQPPSEMSYFEKKPSPVSDLLGRRVISLPSFPTLQDDQIDYICERLASLRRA